MKTLIRKIGLTSVLLALFIGCVQPPAAPNGEIETSDEAGNTVTMQAVPTNGLKGDYYDNVDFTGILKTRYDANINRTWNANAPITGIQPTTYSVRWTGQVMPAFSQTYTFFVTSSDGARLMVNGQALVNDWVDGASRVRSGTVALQANTKYDIRLEYYRNATNPGTVKLEWQSSSRGRQVVPQASLFPIISSVAGAKLIPYTISPDLKNWTSIIASQRSFVYQAQGSIPIDAGSSKRFPVYLLNAQNQIISSDFVTLGQKETLEFSPRTTADYLVISSPVFLGWLEKAKLEMFNRIRQDVRFASLEQKLRVSGGSITAQDAVDLADQIAATLADARIAELTAFYKLGSRGVVRPQKIDQNFPNGVPPYAGYANVVQTGKSFKVQNKSLMNWHVFRVLQTDYAGETPSSLVANGREANCETPQTPKCYRRFTMDDTFDVPGIPLIDKLIAANAFPSESDSFELPSCDKHNIVLSATYIRLNSLTDPGVQNLIGVLNTIFEMAGGSSFAGTTEGVATVVQMGIYLNSVNFFSQLEQLMNELAVAREEDRPARVIQVLRYVFQTISSMSKFVENSRKLFGFETASFDTMVENQLTRMGASTSVLKRAGIADNVAYLAQYASIFTVEARNGIPRGIVSYDKSSLKVTPTEISDIKPINASGQKSVMLENPTTSECAVTYSYDLVTTSNFGVDVKTILYPLGSQVLSSKSGVLKPAEVASIQLDYKCPAYAATFIGTLQISSNATSGSSSIPVKIECKTETKLLIGGMDWNAYDGNKFGGYVDVDACMGHAYFSYDILAFTSLGRERIGNTRIMGTLIDFCSREIEPNRTNSNNLLLSVYEDGYKALPAALSRWEAVDGAKYYYQNSRAENCSLGGDRVICYYVDAIAK